VKRVRVTQPVQDKLGGIFQALDQLFFDGVTEELNFSGDWKPEEDELLLIDPPADAQSILAAAEGNHLALPDLNTANFANEGIRALFVGHPAPPGGHPRVLLQNFSAQQILNRRFTFLQDGNSFKELTESAFALGSALTAVIEGGKIKFKSFHNLRKIFDLSTFYQEATDEQLDVFCGHANLDVGDVPQFRTTADQTIRKLVHTISKSGALDQHDVQTISEKAAALGLHLDLNEGRLVMPTGRRDIKILLRFLDDGVYEASLSQVRYQTNSKRPLP
jgi:hypothetical protein